MRFRLLGRGCARLALLRGFRICSSRIDMPRSILCHDLRTLLVEFIGCLRNLRTVYLEVQSFRGYQKKVDDLWSI